MREGLEPVAFVGAAVDETHVREVEEELRGKTRLLESIVRNLPCGVTVLDDEGRPVLSNENARALLEDPRAAFEVGNPALVEITRRRHVSFRRALARRTAPEGEPILRAASPGTVVSAGV